MKLPIDLCGRPKFLMVQGISCFRGFFLAQIMVNIFNGLLIRPVYSVYRSSSIFSEIGLFFDISLSLSLSLSPYGFNILTKSLILFIRRSIFLLSQIISLYVIQRKEYNSIFYEYIPYFYNYKMMHFNHTAKFCSAATSNRKKISYPINRFQ